MESNDKKWPQKRLSKSHFLRQADVTRKIGQIIETIPEDNEYLVDLFLEQFYDISSENIDSWSALMVDFMQWSYILEEFEKVDVLLQKINIEEISLLQKECLLRSCFRFSKKLKNYTEIVCRIYENIVENYFEQMYIFAWLFSVENGVLKIQTL